MASDYLYDFPVGMLTREEAEVFIAISKGSSLLDRSTEAMQYQAAHYFLDTLANTVATARPQWSGYWDPPTGMILVVNALDIPLRLVGSFDERCKHGVEIGRAVDFTPGPLPEPQDYLAPWQKKADPTTLPAAMEGQPSFGVWVAKRAEWASVGVDFAVCLRGVDNDFAMSTTLYGPYSSGGDPLISLETGTDYRRRFEDDSRADRTCATSWSGTVRGKPVTYLLNAAVENPGATQTYFMTVSIVQAPA